ncbi:DMT family transporter [Flavobacterium aquatile]|uniref:Permease n=1 Tax=Flavobacterium aquatile LMG 4008 = ATCC 11947 TaxID=1453498 RepID=A0A095SS68_9FLAO|nr:DMT family transporter [Flavobacterium aquatile]KGD67194.1 permease [Flavobacterium aquatile LMG 4008 = ATCC 11947]OXA66652.1 EamA family transporter [Flavobacterium aquatile] [Flavobacterium aquatile LMG 4008 = ATCC 11947]GEC78489.1 permease [Flavobacterium aquatile]
MQTATLKWFLLTILALIWGSSFILIKKGLVGLSPMQLGSLRIIFSALFLLIIGFKSLTQIKQYQWKYIALTSLFGTFIPAFLFAVAQTQISSSVSSILNSLTPLNTLIIGGFAFGLTFKRSQIIGVIIGLIGTLLLIINGALNHPNQNYWYTILVLIASICYATNVNLLKKYLSDVKPLSISTGNFVVMLIPALIVLLSTDFMNVVANAEVQNSMIYIVILGVVGTGIANIIFFKLIQMSSPVFATSVTYLIPVVAFFWGLLDNEMLTPIQFIGAFIILIGVYLSSKK